jgi:uncharacterized membrane protein (UPF0127 family)
VTTAFCAFNVERQSFINLGVTIADTAVARLRGLMGKMRLRSDEALWIVPCRWIHTFGLLFPIDVIYLDAELRVVEVVEHLPPFRIARLRWNCASVLQLPAGSVGGSGTQAGDQLLICPPEDMERYWTRKRQEAEKEANPGSEKKNGAVASRVEPKKAV